MEENYNPKVFISYAHKNQEHEDKVLDLANHFRSEGIDIMIDQYEDAPSEGWPRWMENQIAVSDYIVVLCDETYYNKLYSDRKGKGIVWEAKIIYQMLYDEMSISNKFIPAFFDDNDQQYIPLPLKSFTFYNLSDPCQYEKLYWRFIDVTNTKKPPLGKLKPLPVKQRKAMFFSSPIDIEKWDEAKWRGIAYLWGGDAPGIGLFFENYSVGKMIFYEWKNKYKGIDFADDFLKVDYIIPPFPEECWVKKEAERNYGHGYFVYIGANIDASISRVGRSGFAMEDILLTTISRYQWMDELSGSQNRDKFVSKYKNSKKYYLVPVGLKKGAVSATPDSIQFDFDCAIPMKDLTIVSGCELTNDNPCKVVLQRAEK